MKLISASPSPFARKVRIALAEKRIPYDLETEVPWNPDATVGRVNPLGKVPVLILDDGRSVYDSRLILEFLEAEYPDPPLFPADAKERFGARQIEVLADGVCDAVVLIVLERTRPPAKQSRGWIERQQRKVEAGIAALAESAGEPFMLGRHFGLADIAVGSMLAYLDLRLPDFPWRARHPLLLRLLQRLDQRPSFAASVPTAQTIDPAGLA